MNIEYLHLIYFFTVRLIELQVNSRVLSLKIAAGLKFLFFLYILFLVELIIIFHPFLSVFIDKLVDLFDLFGRFLFKQDILIILLFLLALLYCHIVLIVSINYLSSIVTGLIDILAGFGFRLDGCRLSLVCLYIFTSS